MREPSLETHAPWKQRYRARAVLWSQIARNAPTRGVACTHAGGTYQLHGWDVRTGALTQLTRRPEGIVSGGIFPDGRHVWYLDDDGGNEIGHFVRAPFAGGEPEDMTPELPPYASWGLSFSRTGNALGFTLADADGFHALLMDVAPDGALGEPRLIYESGDFTLGPVLSRDGRLAVVPSSERAGKPQFSLLAIDATSGEQMAELWDGPDASVSNARFRPLEGDCLVAATSNRTGDSRPLLWNPRTGERTDVPLDALAGDVTPVDWSPDGRYLLLCHTVAAAQRLYLYDLLQHSLTRLEHPAGTFSWHAESGTYFAPDGDIYAQWEDSRHPPQVVALDAATGAQTGVVLPAGEAPPGRPWRPVTFTSSDGWPVQAWLGLPEGEGPFPTILETHGGPEAVQTERFEPGSQAWIDHGFAYLTINYRGSVTFGREFREAIWGHPGELEVEDMAAARQWLVDQGIARADQVLLTGWSYGGYLTLQALGKRPDLWAGGMAGIAIADWTVMYNECADTLRGYQRALFAGAPEEKPAQYAASSPITYVERVAAPVLILQGRHDTRTPARPVEMYAERMRALGKPIEVHWFEAGHEGPFAHAELGIALQERMLRFAHRVLGAQN